MHKIEHYLWDDVASKICVEILNPIRNDTEYNEKYKILIDAGGTAGSDKGSGFGNLIKIQSYKFSPIKKI